MTTDLSSGERVEELGRGVRIIAAEDAYAYTTDSVLLADFAGVKKGDRVCDLGAGGGILPLLLYARCRDITCVGIEKNASDAARADRSFALNGAQDRLRVLCAEFCEARSLLRAGDYSLVVSNPPYFVSERMSEKSAPESALDDMIAAAAYLTKNGGRFALCRPAASVAELFCKLRAARLEPKTLRFVHGKPSRDAYLVLILCLKNAKPGLTVPPPLILRGEDGAETGEVRRIYGK